MMGDAFGQARVRRALIGTGCAIAVVAMIGCHEPTERMDVRPNGQGGLTVAKLDPTAYPPDEVAQREAAAREAERAQNAANAQRAADAEAQRAAAAQRAADAERVAATQHAADAEHAAAMQQRIDQLQSQVGQMQAEIQRLKQEKAAASGAPAQP